MRRISGLATAALAAMAAQEMGLHEVYDRYMNAPYDIHGRNTKAFSAKGDGKKPSEFESADWWVDKRKKRSRRG